MKRDVFFVGWSPRSALPMIWFLGAMLLVLVGASAGLALALGSTVNDPGGGDFTGDQVVIGVMVTAPYPVIVTDPSPAFPAGHTVLLSGGGKRGVQDQAAPLAGQRVRATGAGVKRGEIDMLLVDTLAAEPGNAPVPAERDLGVWRLSGEICDGKCVLGVMRPGDGPTHKACANVCLTGGVPPVFVATAPVQGTRYMLMGDAKGGRLPDALRDGTGVIRRYDGSVRTLGDVLVFRADVAAAVGR